MWNFTICEIPFKKILSVKLLEEYIIYVLWPNSKVLHLNSTLDPQICKCDSIYGVLYTIVTFLNNWYKIVICSKCLCSSWIPFKAILAIDQWSQNSTWKQFECITCDRK